MFASKLILVLLTYSAGLGPRSAPLVLGFSINTCKQKELPLKLNELKAFHYVTGIAHLPVARFYVRVKISRLLSLLVEL